MKESASGLTSLLLQPFCSFCDVSKRDAYEGSPLSMSHFLRGVRFCPAHIDVLMLERPDDARALFDEVRGAMAELPLLPVTTYPMSQLDEALRFMASGVHIGKLVIETSDVQATLAMPRGVRIGAAGGATSSERADVLCRSVAQALRSSCESGGARADCVVLPQIPDEMDDDAVAAAIRGAEVVITRSKLVAWFAAERLRVPLAIELRCPWRALSPALVRQMMQLRGRGHVVAFEESCGGESSDAEWLPLLVAPCWAYLTNLALADSAIVYTTY